MDSETRPEDERGGDLGLTPRGELWVSFVIAYAAALGVTWAAIWTATHYPAEPAVTPLLPGWSEHWYAVEIILWWVALVVLSIGSLVLGGLLVAMHESQRFRELAVPRSALLRADSIEGEGA